MAAYLLDTHVWLWLQQDSHRVRPAVRDLLRDPSATRLLSVASGWEIAIKYRLGKLPLPEPPTTYIPGRLLRSATKTVPIDIAHALRVAELPAHHNDPFDRLIIAQAQILDVEVITADDALAEYDVRIVRA